nr:ribonuclease H-like domain-containing protein [Tanacetum cinerariifolium]
MNSRGRGTNDTATTSELLTKLLHQIGNLGVCPTIIYSPTNVGGAVAYHAGPTSFTGPKVSPAYPPGFPPQPAQSYTAGLAQSYTTSPSNGLPFILPAQQQGLGSAPVPTTQSTGTPSSHATTVSHAFNTETLQDIASGAWNMDTGASSHLNNSVNSFSEKFNTCMYSSVLVGDGHSIPVTNTDHSILSTPARFLHLNNILITPHIVKNLTCVRQFVRDIIAQSNSMRLVFSLRIS